ncbi:hypothetical protein H3C70_03495 [Patescibacteria group bacterium]|nr:hypothetical protein [Patescibacteria group bacterium]
MKKVAAQAKKVVKKIPRWSAKWLPALIVTYIIIGILSYLTNPFARYTLVRVPFQTELADNGQLSIIEESGLRLRTSRYYGVFAKLKSGYHILGNVYSGTKRAKSETLNDIITDIHALRFDPNEPYLISGDHFSMLYIRSLGIFYSTLLDPRTALNADDWLNRQKIYLQTTKYALEVFKAAPALSTTIVPVGESSVTLMNIYAPPSDSLYSLLYALDVMLSPETLEQTYPFSVEQTPPLQTHDAAQQLLEEYRPTLLRHYLLYQNTIDLQTGLIQKNILLSGTKDIAKRQSAFYDNVIFWKTEQLAQKLGIVPENPQKLSALKQKIIDAFWRPEMGCFLEDQSPEALRQNYYSSDWLIVLSTGFLEPRNTGDRQYYESCVKYIQDHKLDRPFGIKYQQQLRPWRLYPLVRIGAPQYGSTAIWSNWGMEYAKLLALLFQASGNQTYLDEANYQIDQYTDNIIKYECYPEVYDENGQMFKNLFYKSVCQTGWVVTYEQAKALVNSLQR